MSRIVAGTARGRRLETPSGDATRPTTDRVREAFFSVLASWNGSADRAVEEQLSGLSFLDLFAGSGAMGLEAASRGAQPVLMVEADPRAHDVVRRNIETTALPASSRCAKAESVVAVANSGAAHDVVWLDPPYGVGADVLDPLLAAILANGWVRRDGVIIVEQSGRAAPLHLPGTDGWDRRYGDTTLHWFAPLAEEMS